MIDRLFSNTFLSAYINHRNIYLLGLAFILCGLSWSNAMMSIGQIILLCNAALELNFSKKWKAMKSQPILWVLAGFIILHFVGLLWSTNIEYGLKDIRNKLPLIILPLIVVISKPLSKMEWRVLANLYLATLLIITLFSLNKLVGSEGISTLEKRELSINISHIRYGLNLCFAIFIILIGKLSSRLNWAYHILALWFLIAIVLFELYTGLISLLFVSLVILSKTLLSNKKNNTSALIYTSISIALTLFSGTYIYSVYHDFTSPIETSYNQENLNQLTPSNNPYHHDLEDKRKINGVYIARFIELKEVWASWEKRSDMDIHGTDLKGQNLQATLLSFLTSKGVRKDSSTVAELSEKEINAIENGVANVYYLKNNPIKIRIHKTLYELFSYQNVAYANGYSLVMRWIYWKTAWHIIKDNIWFGVGTGDVQDAFKEQYIEENSQLEEQYRRRSHNQYLSIWVGLGLIGLLYFIFSLVYPLFHISGELKALYLSFFLIATLSFLTEDTLETQAGVTFFAIFNSLLLLGFKNQDQTSS